MTWTYQGIFDYVAPWGDGGFPTADIAVGKPFQYTVSFDSAAPLMGKPPQLFGARYNFDSSSVSWTIHAGNVNGGFNNEDSINQRIIVRDGAPAPCSTPGCEASQPAVDGVSFQAVDFFNDGAVDAYVSLILRSTDTASLSVVNGQMPTDQFPLGDPQKLIANGFDFCRVAHGAHQTDSAGCSFGEVHGYLVTEVPEPTTYALMLGGLGLVGYAARRRRLQT